MSYISSIRKGNSVIVWERDESGRRAVSHKAPFYFYVEDLEGTERSIFGTPLKRYDFDTYEDFVKSRTEYQSRRMRLYESDIPPEVKILSELYYNRPTPKLNITLFDIEVDYNEKIGFPSPSNPYAPVCAVSIYHVWQDRSVVYVVPPPGWDEKTFDPSLRDLSEVVICRNEFDLLLYFLAEIEDTDILSGWNSGFFDIPYLCKRIESELGRTHLRRMSFAQAEVPRYRDVELFGRIQTTAELSGRVHLDYLDLFKKYEMTQRPSYKLESIAEEVLPHLPKLSFSGTLAQLYKNNFNHFVRYNVRDTEILKGLEEKLGYVNLANMMCHISLTQFRNVFGTLQLFDMAIVNYCHYDLGGLRVPDYQQSTEDRQIQGAYVLVPQMGLHEWIGSIDINSLYPSSIRSLNLSPETVIGQFDGTFRDWDELVDNSNTTLVLKYDNGIEEERTAKEWREFLKSKKWAVSGYGTVFDQNKPGIVPMILASWYKQRKDYQKLKAQAYEAGDHEQSGYYDRLQYVYKIKLNSCYGALTNFYFRFFDLRFGESTTATGRMILRHQIRKVAELLDGNYNIDLPLSEDDLADTHGKFPSDSIIYGDTDSVYFKTHADDKQQAVMVADEVAKQVNQSFNTFMQDAFLCSSGFDDIIKAGREVVADRGIFVEKKRYVLHVVDLDGNPTDKLKTMGLEMKKTTTPKSVQNFLSATIEMILKGCQWNDVERHVIDFRDKAIDVMEVFDIGLPKGCNKVEEYTRNFKDDPKTRIPGHIAAAIHYNLCLDEYDDHSSPPIISGMKIKVFYLKRDYGRFHSIALPTDIDVIPQWFLDEYQPVVDRYKQAERLVDDNLKLVFKAIRKEVPTRQIVLFDDIFGF
jgi:DNA polymerase elongation subunit (family B)